MIKSLTGIRFYLFLFVLLNHIYTNIIAKTAYKESFKGLFLGGDAVLFFFILSGFCIAINYAEKFNKLALTSVKEFISKRLVKFYPLYFLTGLVIFLFYFIPLYKEKILECILKFIFVYVPMLQPFCPSQYNVGNGSAWFLAALFFCYIFTPFLLHFFGKIKTLKGLLITYFLIYFALSIYSIVQMNLDLTAKTLHRLYNLPILRLLQYTMGLLSGIVWIKFIKNSTKSDIIYWKKSLLDLSVIVIFILSLVSNLVVYGYSTKYGLNLPFENTISTLVFTFIIIYLCNDSKGIMQYITENKVVLFLGGISFECYLIHYIPVALLKKNLVPLCTNYMNIYLIILGMFVVTVIGSILYKYLIKYVKQEIK